MTDVDVAALPDGEYLNIPDEVYHADRESLSVSGAKLLLPPSCPAKFQEYIKGERKSKRIFDFGHLAHRIVLGDGPKFAVLDPAVHGLKKDGTLADSPRATAGWKQAEAEARERGLIPVSVDEWSVAEEMARKVYQHPDAGRRFAEGTAEVSVYHTDPETGVRLRGRFDWLEPNGDLDDYKTSTTANPAELVRKFYALGYFMQAAWYIDLAIATGLSESPTFRFIVQEKVPPYVVAPVRYDDEAIAEGRRRNRQAIRLYAELIEAGHEHWPGYADETVTISLPRWATSGALQTEAEALIAELEGIYQ